MRAETPRHPGTTVVAASLLLPREQPTSRGPRKCSTRYAHSNPTQIWLCINAISSRASSEPGKELQPARSIRIIACSGGSRTSISHQQPALVNARRVHGTVTSDPLFLPISTIRHSTRRACHPSRRLRGPGRAHSQVRRV